MTVQVHLTGLLGTQISVTVENETAITATLRDYGRKGWTSGTVPTGGYILPHSMADGFDWALIGARPWTSPENEVCVIHRGHTYKRRDFDAVDSKKMKMPAAVKYSRGAKPTDPDHIREKGDGEFEYVTLIVFRGNGKAIAEFMTQQPQRAAQPAPAVAPAPEPQAAPAAPTNTPIRDMTATFGTDRAHKLHQYLGRVLKGTEYESKHASFVSTALGRDIGHLQDILNSEAVLLSDRIEEFKAGQLTADVAQ